ncbi:TniB family NTP-binding protein [Bradyrhizobium sp. RP6]|uniref:TniB family NTP-binding protein n=1 Tax=Bradyrhizobium sp. RP6 TaxID=2489596 RepID=UPI000F5259A9|nr:TniB family NTP-binding protein [Bradyrhizobium sp. RP6]RQH12664.1 AAA family ATPase [Bradyrhizobium sp. RP6]
MTENFQKKMVAQNLRDADEALYSDIDRDRKFNRLQTTDPQRLARRAKLKSFRAIDVSTAKGAAAKEYLEAILDRMDSGIEGYCLVLHGRTGAGKTHIIERLVAHPDLRERETEEGKYRPLLKIVAPAPCTLKTLGLRILHQLGYRPKKSLRENEVWDRVEANLRAQGVGILVIDEMHNVLAGRNSAERHKIAMTLKSLMVSDANPVQLILAGLDSLKKFVTDYSELHRRTHFVELVALEAVKDSKKFMKFLKALEEKLGMETCGFTENDMPHRFWFASRGLVGRMAYFAQEAATIAVCLDDEVVREEHLAEAYRRPYGIDDARNPFLVLNPRLLKMPKKEEDIRDDETFLRGTKKRRTEDDEEELSEN